MDQMMERPSAAPKIKTSFLWPTRYMIQCFGYDGQNYNLLTRHSMRLQARVKVGKCLPTPARLRLWLKRSAPTDSDSFFSSEARTGSTHARPHTAYIFWVILVCVGGQPTAIWEGRKKRRNIKHSKWIFVMCLSSEFCIIFNSILDRGTAFVVDRRSRFAPNSVP